MLPHLLRTVTISQPRTRPRRSHTDADQNPPSQARCVAPDIRNLEVVVPPPRMSSCLELDVSSFQRLTGRAHA